MSIPEVSGVEDDFGFDGIHFEDQEEFIEDEQQVITAKPNLEKVKGPLLSPNCK